MIVAKVQLSFLLSLAGFLPCWLPGWPAGWPAGWLAGSGEFLAPVCLFKAGSFFAPSFEKVKKELQNSQETPNGIAEWENDGPESPSAL